MTNSLIRSGDRGLTVVAAALIWLGLPIFALADVAHAAFPGQNGQIAFQSFRDNSFRSDIMSSTRTEPAS